jgi:hypothetical protein
METLAGSHFEFLILNFEFALTVGWVLLCSTQPTLLYSGYGAECWQ